MVFPSELFDFHSFHSVVLTFPLSCNIVIFHPWELDWGKEVISETLILLKLRGSQYSFGSLLCHASIWFAVHEQYRVASICQYLQITTIQYDHIFLGRILSIVNILSHVCSLVTILVGLFCCWSWCIVNSECCTTQSLCPVNGFYKGGGEDET